MLRRSIFAFMLLCAFPGTAEEEEVELNNSRYFFEKKNQEEVLLEISSPVKEVVEFLPKIELKEISNEIVEDPIVVAPQTTLEQQSILKAERSCYSPYHNMNIGLRHNEARGIGYKQGYTTLEGFWIEDRFSERLMPFLDLRAHLFNNGKWAGNVGIGERTLLSRINHIFGAYLYYDVRNDSKLTIHQLSPGLELLSKRMECRINAYFPLGKHKSGKYDYQFDSFEGNEIFLQNKQKFGMRGFNAEVGAHLAQSRKIDTYLGVGPYYISAFPDSSWGAQARLKGRFKEYITLEFVTSYDKIFHSIFQGSISFNYPFGHNLKRKGKGCSQQADLLMSRVAFAPSRWEIPVMKVFKKKSTAINPLTNAPWFVLFVDNTSNSLGTFESPFPTLAQAETASHPSDIIYVFPGDGTTHGMDNGITLKNFQKLFGSGVSHPINTTHGQITIPALSTAYPQIENKFPSGDVVAIRDGNEISGFTLLINHPFQAGISGDGWVNTTIDRNNFIGSAFSNGIDLKNMLGKIMIKNNTMNSSKIGGFGIGIQETLGIMEITNNTVVGYGTALDVDVSLGKIQVESNFISGFGDNALFLAIGSQNVEVNILSNTIVNNEAFIASIAVNIIAESMANLGVITIDSNKITTFASGSTALSILTQLNTSQPVHITNNQIIGNAVHGIVMQSTGNASMCLRLLNNTSRTSGINPDYQFSTAGGGVIQLEPPIGNMGTFGPFDSGITLVPSGTCN